MPSLLLDGDLSDIQMVLLPYERSLLQVHYRLARGLQQMESFYKEGKRAPLHLTRRVGFILQRCIKLIQEVKEYASAMKPASSSSDMPSDDAPYTGLKGILVEILDQLLRDVVKGHHYLHREVRMWVRESGAPFTEDEAVGLVGSVAYELTKARSPASSAAWSVRKEAGERRLPTAMRCAIHAVIHEEAVEEPIKSTPVAAAVEVKNEEAVLAEVQQLVHQVKQHAVQLGEWVTGEDRAALEASEQLLSKGVEENRSNMKALEQLPGGREALGRRPAPRFVAALPYGSLLWSQLLLPMWDVMKQVLLMLLCLALTGFALLTILMYRRPHRQFPLPPHTPSSLPPLSSVNMSRASFEDL